jgi:hypothetical protein
MRAPTAEGWDDLRFWENFNERRKSVFRERDCDRTLKKRISRTRLRPDVEKAYFATGRRSSIVEQP